MLGEKSLIQDTRMIIANALNLLYRTNITMQLRKVIELVSTKRKVFANHISREFLMKLGFTFSIIVLFYVSFISYNTNRKLIENAKLVDHTNEVISKLNNILITFKDAQLGEKIYLITSEERYLTAYNMTQGMINSELNAIAVLTTDNAKQQANVVKARKLMAENFEQWNAIIALKKNNPFVDNQSNEPAEVAVTNAHILAMRYEELNLLKIRSMDFDTSSTEAPNFLIVLAIVSMVLSIGFYFIISSNIRSIRKIAKDKQQAFEEAQATNEELTATSDELKHSFEKISNYKMELESSKDRLLEAENIANMGNWEWDIDNDHITWSDNLTKIYEYNPTTNPLFSYETYLGLIHHEDRQLMNTAVLGVLKNSNPYSLEHRMIAKDGSIKWLLSKGKLVTENEKASKLFGTAIDITDLKYAQTEEEKLVAVVDNSSDFIGLGDEAGNLIFINDAGLKILGLERSKKELNIRIIDYFASEDLDFIAQHIMPYVAEHGKWSGEINIINAATKEMIPICWNVFQVKDRANANIGFGHIIQDMRSDKKIKYELLLKNELLETTIAKLQDAEQNLKLSNSELEARVLERGRALIVSEERFRLVSLATNDAIWDWDLQTDRLWWNEGFNTMFGYQTDQLEHGIEALHSRIYPEDRTNVVQDIRKFLASGNTQWNGEYRFQNSEGQYVHVMERGYAMHDGGGKPYRMLGSLINITERKELEVQRLKLHDRAVAQRQKLYGLLMDLPAAVTIMKGSELIYEMVNASYKTMFDAKEQLIGKSRKKISRFQDSDAMLHILLQVYNTGVKYTEKEYKSIVFKNEEKVVSYFNILIEPIYDSDNQIDGVMTFAMEVTDHVLARKEEEKSAQKLALMLETIPQMAWTAEPDGTISYFNSKWYEYTGSNFEELKANWAKYLHPEDRAFAHEAWNDSITTGENYQLEYRWLRASDNTYRWMLGRAKPVKNKYDETLLWVGTCTDINDQKLVNEALDKKNQELIKVNELLDTFVYTAAHDLKSPVINLKSLFDLIKTTDDPSTKQKYFNTIDVAVSRLDDTITGLVEVIEVQSQDNKLAKEISFEEVLALTIADFDADLRQIKGEVVGDFDELPIICYLKSYMASIFTNLISNAIKYRSIERQLRIELKSYVENGYVVLTVKDNGTGIDMAKNGTKIFKAFNRFTRSAQGKGLGLYLVKTMVERNGGKLEAESELNVGTRFKIYLKEYK